MNSRMEKYNNSEDVATSRTSRNKNLYNEIKNTELTKFNSFSNVKVIDEGAKEIDLNKIKKYIDKLNGEPTTKRKSLLDNRGLYEEKTVPVEEEKDYDIISVLEKAREKREIDYEKERYKKLRDTQYDILSNLKIEDKKFPEDEEKFNTQEKTLIDLINTVAVNKNKNDLLSELSSDDEPTTGSIDEESNNEDLKALIKEEIEKDKTKEVPKEENNVENIDNSFYTSSLNFSKEDFEDFNDVEEGERKGIFAKIGIILLILCILGVLLLIANFVFDLNII